MRRCRWWCAASGYSSKLTLTTRHSCLFCRHPAANLMQFVDRPVTPPWARRAQSRVLLVDAYPLRFYLKSYGNEIIAMDLLRLVRSPLPQNEGLLVYERCSRCGRMTSDAYDQAAEHRRLAAMFPARAQQRRRSALSEKKRWKQRSCLRTSTKRWISSFAMITKVGL